MPATADRTVVTIMFMDIRGSSRVEERLSPQRTLEFMKCYLDLAAQAILANNGSINQFIGDGIMAIFGLLDEPDHGAANAIAAAEAIHGAFESSSAVATSPEPTGAVDAIVAMHTGIAIVGLIGPGEHSHYAVLGRAVNIASRLEREGKELGIRTVVSGSTVAALKEPPASLHLVTRKILRGLSETVEIWSNDPIQAPHLVDASTRSLTGFEARDTNPTLDSSGTKPRNWTAFATAAVVAGALVTSFAVVVGLRLGGQQFIFSFADVAQVTAALIAAAACSWITIRSDGRLRLGWALIAASATAWAIGQATWTIHQLGLGCCSPSTINWGSGLPSRIASCNRWRALLLDLHLRNFRSLARVA